MFSIDGVEYRVKCTTTRSAEIKETSISGLMMDGSYFRDIRGTYYSYEIRLEMPLKNKGRYAGLIEQLTEPVDGHQFVLPYNNETILLTGKVADPKDVFKELESGYTYWDGLQFSIAPNGPSKQVTLDGVIQRGRTPLPNVQAPNIGDTYTWDGSEWVSYATPPDADNISY